MPAQTFDTEQIGKIQQAQETIHDAFSKIVPAFEASIEVAHKNQIAALENECNSGMEAAQQVTKLEAQLQESLDTLVDYLKRMDNAMQG